MAKAQPFPNWEENKRVGFSQQMKLPMYVLYIELRRDHLEESWLQTRRKRRAEVLNEGGQTICDVKTILVEVAATYANVVTSFLYTLIQLNLIVKSISKKKLLKHSSNFLLFQVLHRKFSFLLKKNIGNSR